MSVFVNFHEICGEPSLNNLDEVFTSFCRTPLHIAVISGNIKLATEIVSRKPDLALKKDFNGFTPLHLASARTSRQMVRLLLNARPAACLVKDKDGRTPLHLAVMKDRVEIMKLLMEERPDPIHLKNDENGETILHFCVKNNNEFTSLKLLVDKLVLAWNFDRDTAISINSKDNDGNTVLHLAAGMGKLKIVNQLLQSNDIRIDIDAINNKGLKPLNLLSEADKNDLEMGFYNHSGHNKELSNQTFSENKYHKQVNKKSAKKHGNADRVNALLVVATLIGQIAFQAALNPPGGVWQDDSKVNSNDDPVTFAYYLHSMFGSTISERVVLNTYSEAQGNVSDFINGLIYETFEANNNTRDSAIKGLIVENFTGATISTYSRSEGGDAFFPYLIRYAGFPIMAYKHPTLYVIYMLVNTIAFSLSLAIVFAVICEFVHEKSVAQNRVLVMLMCISIGCISISYLAVFLSLAPDFFIDDQASFSVSIYFLLCCICGIGFLLWKLISRMVKQHKRHLTAFNYFKALFKMDACAVGKVVLVIVDVGALYATYKASDF
ncbi:hypothetical protein MKX03_021335 [Papaver bracteatum]|nr:hypothetical protein MKX03_021335 [Papaver bracteatum]